MELLNTRMFNWQNGRVSGLAKHMDIIILNNNCIVFNKSLDLAQTIKYLFSMSSSSSAMLFTMFFRFFTTIFS